MDTPAELVTNASRQGISILGVTDHDTVDALADVAPDISQAAEPKRLRSGWLNAIKEMQVSYK